jgi:hypothetical protein
MAQSSSTSFSKRSDSSSDAQQLLAMNEQAQALAFAVAALQALPQSSSSSSSSTRCSNIALDSNSRNTALTAAAHPAKGEAHNEAIKMPCTSRQQLPHEKAVTTAATCSTDAEPCAISSSSNDSVVECGDDKETLELRVQRNRERNREHARKTRLRKKAHVAALQTKMQALQAERDALRQQRCLEAETVSIADILLHLSSSPTSSADAATVTMNEPFSLSTASNITSCTSNESEDSLVWKRQGRCRFASSSLSTTTTEATVGAGSVKPRPATLTLEQLETLRYDIESCLHRESISWIARTFVCSLFVVTLYLFSRERNRQHAKMTRNRKKCFVATLEQAIVDLERELTSLRSRVNISCDQTVTARSMVTPELSAVPSPPLDVVSSSSLVSVEDEPFNDSKRSGEFLRNDAGPAKRLCRHGFSLDTC